MAAPDGIKRCPFERPLLAPIGNGSSERRKSAALFWENTLPAKRNKENPNRIIRFKKGKI
jgi:hypothetical protein